MIKLMEILCDLEVHNHPPTIEREGVRFGITNPQTLDIDLTRDEIDDLILINDEHEREGRGHKHNNNVITYRAFRFNENSKYLKYSNDKNAIKRTIRKIIKNIDSTAMDYNKFVQMIDMSIHDFFSRHNDINPIIIPLPSTSNLNSLIIDRIRKIRGNDIITYDIFKKMMTDEIEVNVERVNRQRNPETRERIYKQWNSIKAAHPGQPFQVKFSTPSMKKFFYFLKFANDDSRDILNKFANGNIMLVDDTVSSEKNTFNEAIRLLKEFNPPTIFCYGFLLDY